jgi:hypothetical protein
MRVNSDVLELRWLVSSHMLIRDELSKAVNSKYCSIRVRDCVCNFLIVYI